MAARLRNTPSGLRPFSVGPWQRALTEGAKIGNKSLKKASSPLLSTPFLSTPLLSQDLSDGKKNSSKMCGSHKNPDRSICPLSSSLELCTQSGEECFLSFPLLSLSLHPSASPFYPPPPIPYCITDVNKSV